MYRKRGDIYELLVFLGVFIIYSVFQFEYDQPFVVFVAGAMTIVFGIVLKINRR